MSCQHDFGSCSYRIDRLAAADTRPVRATTRRDGPPASVGAATGTTTNARLLTGVSPRGERAARCSSGSARAQLAEPGGAVNVRRRGLGRSASGFVLASPGGRRCQLAGRNRRVRHGGRRRTERRRTRGLRSGRRLLPWGHQSSIDQTLLTTRLAPSTRWLA